MKRNRTGFVARLGRPSFQMPNPPDPPPPQPPQLNDEGERLRYELETARALSARLQSQMAELQKQVPSDEQRTRWAELEAAHQRAEEDRLKKEGDFNAWRQQIEQRHQQELEAERQMRQNETARREATERELVDTLIGREFADAATLFGPTGKTVLLPAVAQAYFASHVTVETIAGVNGGPQRRRVIVKDAHGAPILDTKTGQPETFVKAMEILIDSHPQRDYLLRGSMKVGAGSSGGGHGTGQDVDVSRLRPADFADPKVREAVRDKQRAAGGMQIGPAFDRMQQNRRK